MSNIELSRLAKGDAGQMNMVHEVGHVGGAVVNVCLKHKSIDIKRWSIQSLLVYFAFKHSTIPSVQSAQIPSTHG